MRRGIGVGFVAASALGLVSHEVDAQLQPIKQTPQGPQGIPTVGPVGTQTVTLGQIDWASVAQKAFDAEAYAVEQWKTQATISGSIYGASLSVSPGGLSGPSTAPDMKTKMVAAGVPIAVAEKFATTFDRAFTRWQGTWSIPSFPAYPAFVGWPGGDAAPMPNIPFPLGTGVATGAADLSALSLGAALRQALGSLASTPEAQNAINTFAAATNAAFTQFLATGQIMNLLGQGHVPSFAPPYVPVGPVVGGNTVASPGVIFSASYGSAGAALTAFDGLLGGWKVTLESGKATATGTDLTLTGTVVIKRDGYPSSFRIRDALLVLKTAQPSGSGGGGGGLTRPPLGNPVLTNVLTTGYVSLKGSGTLELVSGATVLTYPTSSVKFESQPDGSLSFAIDTASADVCRIQIGAGSGALLSGARMRWDVRCPHDMIANADLTLTSTTLTGTGMFKAYGASFGVSFSLDEAQKVMRARAAWSPGGTTWRGLPGFTNDLEYATESPSVTVDLTVSSRSVNDPKKDATPRVTMNLSAGKLSVRTKATRPNGQPWATASTPNINAQLYFDGTVKSPFPSLSAAREPRANPVCNVSCDVLRTAGLSGLVPPVQGVLEFNSDWSKCVPMSDAASRAGCGGPTMCPAPGMQRVTEDGRSKCELIAPSFPQPPNKAKLRELF